LKKIELKMTEIDDVTFTVTALSTLSKSSANSTYLKANEIQVRMLHR
jgi:hypothetical protein